MFLVVCLLCIIFFSTGIFGYVLLILAAIALLVGLFGWPMLVILVVSVGIPLSINYLITRKSKQQSKPTTK